MAQGGEAARQAGAGAELLPELGMAGACRNGEIHINPAIFEKEYGVAKGFGRSINVVEYNAGDEPGDKYRFDVGDERRVDIGHEHLFDAGDMHGYNAGNEHRVDVGDEHLFDAVDENDTLDGDRCMVYYEYDNPITQGKQSPLPAVAGTIAASAAVTGLAGGTATPTVAFGLFALLLAGLSVVFVHVRRA